MAGRRLKNHRNRRFYINLISLLVLVAAFLAVWAVRSDSEPVLATQSSKSKISVFMDGLTLSDQLVHTIIKSCLPIVSVLSPETKPQTQGAAAALTNAFGYLVGTRLDDPRTFFQAQLAMAGVGFSEQTSIILPLDMEVDEEEEEVIVPEQPGSQTEEEEEAGQAFSAGEAVVGIYHTHNAESYIPTDGKAKLEGENAGVFSVGDVLAAELRDKYKINTVQAQTIHDYPDWNLSYVNSEKTVKQLLKANPKIRMLIDIHRDSGIASREASRVNIDGKKAAKILIIVGTNTRFNHPEWKENYAFAQQLEDKMNQIYPGLLKAVRLRPGRYNQHLHPHSLLIEIGSDKNSLAEAEQAALMLARVVSEVLK